MLYAGIKGDRTLVIAALLAEPWQARLDALRAAHFPAGRNRVPAHVSLLHKLPGDLLDAAAQEITARVNTLSPLARLAGIRLLAAALRSPLTPPA